MADIFVSYSQVDKDRVRPIVDALEVKGWSVWWDPEGAAGSIIDEMVESELTKAKCVVVVWSKASVKSDWVIGEADEARKRRILIPVAIDDDAPPLRFRRFNTVFLSSSGDIQSSSDFQKFLLGVQAYVKARSSQEPKIIVDPPDNESGLRKWLLAAIPIVFIVATVGYWQSTGEPEPQRPDSKPQVNEPELTIFQPEQQQEPVVEEAPVEVPYKGVKVESDPSGASIFIDGELVGRTPTTLRGFERGRTAEVRFDLDGYEPAVKTVTAPNEGLGQVSMSLTKVIPKYALTIETEPRNATVRLLDNVIEYKPGVLLARGRYKVEVSGVGYVTMTEWVDVAGRDMTHSIKLEREEPIVAVGGVFRDCESCPEMVVVPSGTFKMGSEEWNLSTDNKQERPAHDVEISSFAIGKYELTVAQFDHFVTASKYDIDADQGEYRKGCSTFLNKDVYKLRSDANYMNPGWSQSDRHPAVCVTWNDAQAYVEFLSEMTGKNYRLPSEAELEYVIRAGSTTDYPWGDEFDGGCKYANVAGIENAQWFEGRMEGLPCRDGYAFTSPVGSFSPNAFGIYDTVGNVQEFAQEDRSHSSYVGATSNGLPWLAGGEPGWAPVRGGNWLSASEGSFRSAERDFERPYERRGELGFRVARDFTHKKFPLIIETTPPNAIVKILNIESTYEPGMLVEPGRYRVEVSSGGFQTVKQWISVSNRNVSHKIALVKTTNPEYPKGGVFRDCNDCPEMIVIAAGSFMMGSPPNESGRDDDEGPVHQVNVRRFAIGRYEVTFDEYDKFAKSIGRSMLDDNGWGRGRRPAINVHRKDALLYAEWLARTTGLSYRLLSEAEWEYAARAGTKTRFWWGDQLRKDLANFSETANNFVATKPVDNYQPNPFGLFNVLGNVAEIVKDCYQSNYYGAPDDGTVWVINDECIGQVIRGGSVGSWPDQLRSAARGYLAYRYRDRHVGFRVARDLD